MSSRPACRARLGRQLPRLARRAHEGEDPPRRGLPEPRGPDLRHRRRPTASSPGIYTAEELSPLDVDVLSTTPQAFPSPATGTDDEARTGEVWLTGGDVNADGRPDRDRRYRRHRDERRHDVPFTGFDDDRRPAIAASPRAIPRADAAPDLQAADRLADHDRSRPHDGGKLVLAIDTHAWFSNVDFTALEPAGVGFVFPDDERQRRQPEPLHRPARRQRHLSVLVRIETQGDSHDPQSIRSVLVSRRMSQRQQRPPQPTVCGTNRGGGLAGFQHPVRSRAATASSSPHPARRSRRTATRSHRPTPTTVVFVDGWAITYDHVLDHGRSDHAVGGPDKSDDRSVAVRRRQGRLDPVRYGELGRRRGRRSIRDRPPQGRPAR